LWTKEILFTSKNWRFWETNMVDEMIVGRTVRKYTTNATAQKMNDLDGPEDVLTTRAFFEATNLDESGGVVCVSDEMDLNSLLPPFKIGKHNSSMNEETFLFYNIDEMYIRQAETPS